MYSGSQHVSINIVVSSFWQGAGLTRANSVSCMLMLYGRSLHQKVKKCSEKSVNIGKQAFILNSKDKNVLNIRCMYILTYSYKPWYGSSICTNGVQVFVL